MSLNTLVAAWNSRDPATIAGAYAPDGVRVEYALPGARLEGRDAIAAHVAGYIHAVPECVLTVRGEYAGADGTEILEWTFHGIHSGSLPDLPARGMALELHGVSVCTMEDGLVTQERVYWDGATLLASAGVIG